MSWAPDVFRWFVYTLQHLPWGGGVAAQRVDARDGGVMIEIVAVSGRITTPCCRCLQAARDLARARCLRTSFQSRSAPPRARRAAVALRHLEQDAEPCAGPCAAGAWGSLDCSCAAGINQPNDLRSPLTGRRAGGVVLCAIGSDRSRDRAVRHTRRLLGAQTALCRLRRDLVLLTSTPHSTDPLSLS